MRTPILGSDSQPDTNLIIECTTAAVHSHQFHWS
jgi:hypothetical protein